MRANEPGGLPIERSEYRALIARLEGDARRDPRAHRRLLTALVALGYGYVLIVVGAVVVAMIVLGWLMVTEGSAAVAKVLFVLGALLVIIVRSLQVHIPGPKGTAVTTDQAPRFFKRVEEIRAAMSAPAPDEVLLTDDFNAAVTQVPQMGLLDVPRTYLIIGVPLLYALTPLQFDAVLAHEFGHLSGSHPKRGLRVHRVARTWTQLIHQLEEQRSWGSIFFRRFFQWYVPRLDAYAFVMSRSDELEADRDAASVTSPAAIGSALVALELRGRYFEEVFWSDTWARAREQAEPVEAWRAIPQSFRESDLHPSRGEWLGAALMAQGNENDTHPSLSERLTNLGLLPAADNAQTAVHGLLTPLDDSAAQHYLPEIASAYLQSTQHKWRKEVAKTWAQHFESTRTSRARLAELTTRDREQNDLSADELWEVAALTAELSGDEAAIDVTRRSLAARDENPHAHFLLGRALLATDAEASERHLRRTMTLDPEATPAVLQMLFSIYQARGDEQQQHQLEEEYNAWARMMQEAEAERRAIDIEDKFEAPILKPEELAALQATVDSTEGIRDALVGRKTTKHLPNRQLLVVLLRTPMFRSPPHNLVNRFLSALKLECDLVVQLEQGVFNRFAPILEDSGAIRLTPR